MKQTLVNFVADMVLAINEDRKTQTRRIIKPQPTDSMWDIARGNLGGDTYRAKPGVHPVFGIGLEITRDGVTGMGFTDPNIPCPFGRTGDRIGVRERARVLGYPEPGKMRILYEADGKEEVVKRPLRLRHVKVGNCIPNGCHREAVRTWLEITAVRVERLNEISEVDAIAEGILSVRSKEWDLKYFPVWREAFERALSDGVKPPLGPSPATAFSKLWESIYGPGSFDDRWVWVVEFERVTS